MQIYARVEAPETCYISEAVFWLAFGRFPMFEHDENGRDTRRNVDVILEHFSATLSPQFFFFEEEIRRFLPEVPVDEYSSAMIRTGGQSPEEVAKGLSQHEAIWRRIDPSLLLDHDHRMHEQNKKELEEDLALSEWLRNVQQPLHHMKGIARSRVFQDLAEGRLTSEGVVAADQGEVVTGEFHSIPPTAWIYEKVVWEDSNLDHPDVGVEGFHGYAGVQVPVLELLSLYPAPSPSTRWKPE